jgi:hypothetical protein
MSSEMNAAHFIERLEVYRSPEHAKQYLRYFKTCVGEYGEGDIFMNVGMEQVFELAREFINMPPAEIEKLLENPIHEVRAGGYHRLCLATLYATVGKGL